MALEFVWMSRIEIQFGILLGLNMGWMRVLKKKKRDPNRILKKVISDQEYFPQSAPVGLFCEGSQ